MTKIAVTGGAGFIGEATLRAGQAQGHEVWTFDRNDGCDILGDLSALDDAEAVIHLAGVLGTHELFDSPEEAVTLNVVGATRIMQWCSDNDATYVGILMPDVFPSIYTATKVGAYRIAKALQHSRGLVSAHVRAFNAYGPGQKWGKGHPQKIIPTFAMAAWNREPLPIFGSGNQTVDLIHVDDVGRMLIDAVDLADNDWEDDVVLDAGSGVAMTVNQVAYNVVRMAGWEGGVDRFLKLEMRDGEIEQPHLAATGQGWDRLSWRPRHDLNLLNETVQWYAHQWGLANMGPIHK